SQALLNSTGISYIKTSLSNFSKPYLFKKKKINRWQMSYGKIRKHKGKGYSDHLPVVASFLIE
ncbi:MAG: endonuclease, partial [Sulfurimonas sp.]